MTGRRFHCFSHIEISAVCTHPGYLGKGYAKQLLLSQLTQILASSYKPYLHVKADNERAIRVYESLGFRTRMPVFFYVLEKSLHG
jgi:predicted GNAT family acetyltransferase